MSKYLEWLCDYFIRLWQKQQIPFKTGCCSHYIALLYFRKVLPANWQLTLLHILTNVSFGVWRVLILGLYSFRPLIYRVIVSLSRDAMHKLFILGSNSIYHTFHMIRRLSVVLRICKSFADLHLHLDVMIYRFTCHVNPSAICSQNCKFISQNSEKKVVIARYSLN